MNSTTWTAAPAGFSAAGTLALAPVCPAVVGGTGVVMVPTAAPSQGSGVPAAARPRLIDERGAARQSFLQQAPAVPGTAPLSAITDSTDIDGTTLGLHFPGRPQS